MRGRHPKRGQFCLTSQSGGGVGRVGIKSQDKQSFFRGTLARVETIEKLPFRISGLLLAHA
jgi:hypothetical protein